MGEGKEKTTITVEKEARDDIREIKPDGVTWSWFLKQAARCWERKNEH